MILTFNVVFLWKNTKDKKYKICWFQKKISCRGRGRGEWDIILGATFGLLVDPLTCMICRLHAIDYPDSPLVRHLPIFDQPAWQPISFPTYYLCKSQIIIDGTFCGPAARQWHNRYRTRATPRLFASVWIQMAWPPRGQQVSHQRLIWGSRCMKAMKHPNRGSILALKPRGDITRSPQQGYEWPDKKDLCPPKNLFKEKETINDIVLFYLILYINQFTHIFTIITNNSSSTHASTWRHHQHCRRHGNTRHYTWYTQSTCGAPKWPT